MLEKRQNSRDLQKVTLECSAEYWSVHVGKENNPRMEKEPHFFTLKDKKQ